ncbi:hypothetical protein BDF19DRAFT_446038 [Syncephalis fuscata]|nr:hypothetical protein BDF19DRAFT_446038 [Syncephalis fuscata]
MPISRLELLFAMLPVVERDIVLLCLSDDELQELELTNHGTQTFLKQSNQYWRGLYGRKFHWRYVRCEEYALIWYRNKVWRKQGQPAGSVVDLLGDSLGNTAFLGVNWRLAYNHRLLIERNWREAKFVSQSYEHYSLSNRFDTRAWSSCSSATCIMPISGDVKNVVIIRPSELPATIDDAIPLVDHTVAGVTSNSFSQLYRHVAPIVPNDYYTVIRLKDDIWSRPTYSDHQWKRLELSFCTGYSVDSFRFRSSGRWVIFFKTPDPCKNWLVNLLTGQYHEISGVSLASFSTYSDKNGIQLFDLDTNRPFDMNGDRFFDQNSISWNQTYYQLSSSGFKSEVVSSGSFNLPEQTGHCNANPLSVEFTYLQVLCNQELHLAIYSTKNTGAQEPIFTFKNASTASLINRWHAIVKLQDVSK